MLTAPPLGLYVHLPWCVSKCPYCDFNSHALRGRLPESAYRDALLADLDEELAAVPERTISSIFFGGGTPSLFSPSTIGRLIESVESAGRLAESAEITLEANPGTVEHASFADLRAAGINRVSLGVQSFDAEQLSVLGRIHGPDEALRAIEEVHRAGIPRLNADLMFGLPGQTPEGALRDVEIALDAGVRHLSHYQLTLEPNTLFYSDPPELPDNERIWAALQRCQAALAGAGLEQYEVSAYAVPGQECVHNLNYWTFGDYLGVGAGAHGKLTYPAEDRIVRRSKKRHPAAYMPGPLRTEESRLIDRPRRVFEFMLNALRLKQGFPESQFEERTGVMQQSVQPGFDLAIERGLLESRAGTDWRPTDLGYRFLNDLQAIFLPLEGEERG
jgi:oxygen-independent coproporphyrinogen-3 oxidase